MRLLVKNFYVILFYSYSFFIFIYYVLWGVFFVRVFIGFIKVSVVIDLVVGWIISIDILILNIFICNVIIKLVFIFNWYLFIYLFIFIFIFFCRKRDKCIKIFYFDVDDCSVGLYIF